MTATEELRKGLDERGIEWQEEISFSFSKATSWEYMDYSDIANEHGTHCSCEYTEYEDGKTTFYISRTDEGCTPQQAIEAVLGRRTCQMEYIEGMSGDELYPTEVYECSVCGEVTYEGKPNFCPNCGAKVINNDQD